MSDLAPCWAPFVVIRAGPSSPAAHITTAVPSFPGMVGRLSRKQSQAGTLWVRCAENNLVSPERLLHLRRSEGRFFLTHLEEMRSTEGRMLCHRQQPGQGWPQGQSQASVSNMHTVKRVNIFT